MHLHIIRHADPDYANNTITEFGHEEAEALSKYLVGEKIDKIYTSPLGRAIDTARPTLEKKNMTFDILPWTEESMDYMRKADRLTGCMYSWSANADISGLIDCSSEERHGATAFLSENSDKFLASLGYEKKGGLYEVTKENHDSIAVFCHGGFGSAWISYLLGKPAELGFLSFCLRTTSISSFYFRDEIGEKILPRAIQIGAIPHIIKEGLRINDR